MDVTEDNNSLNLDDNSIKSDTESDCSSEINQNEYKESEIYPFFYCLIPKNALCNGNYVGIIPDELKQLTIFEKSSISIYNPMTKIMMRGFDRFPYHQGKIYTIVNNMVEKLNVAFTHQPRKHSILCVVFNMILHSRSVVCAPKLFEPFDETCIFSTSELGQGTRIEVQSVSSKQAAFVKG